MTQTQKIALFGGSFDPIHLGHLAMAVDVIEKCQFDTLYLCPANKNPLKPHSPSASGQERLQMVKEAIKGICRLEVLDLELNRASPSYTIDTLLQLKELHNQGGRQVKLYLLLGEDSAAAFYRWHQPQEIIQLASLVVGCRSIERNDLLAGVPEEFKALLEKAFVKTRFFEVSSSEIRGRIAAGKVVHHLLPYRVAQYIHSKGLYVHD